MTAEILSGILNLRILIIGSSNYGSTICVCTRTAHVLVGALEKREINCTSAPFEVSEWSDWT